MSDERPGSENADLALLRRAAAEAMSTYEMLRPSLEQLRSVSLTFDALRLLPPLPTFDVAADLRRVIVAASPVTTLVASAPAMLPRLQLSEQMREMFATQLTAIDYAKGLVEQLRANFDLVGTLRIAEQFGAYLRTLRPAEWLLARRLDERGWWLVPGMDEELIDRLGVATDYGRRGRVGTLIVRYYTVDHPRRLNAMAHAWKLREFREHGRIEVFRQALRSLRRGDYAVATIALTMQIEGITKDFLYNEGLITADVQRSGKSPVPLFRAHLAVDGEPYFSGFTEELERLYAHYAGPQTHQRRPNRHGQAHGGEVPANSPREVIRAFLRLQTLHFHLNEVRRRRHSQVA